MSDIQVSQQLYGARTQIKLVDEFKIHNNLYVLLAYSIGYVINIDSETETVISHRLAEFEAPCEYL